MKTRTRSTLLPCALALLAGLSACGCGARSYGRGLRRLAPFGVRAGWVDLGGFELADSEEKVADRPLLGLYLRTSVKGQKVVEFAADAAVDIDAPDEHIFYSAGLSLLWFPSKYGFAYLHAGGGVMSETTAFNDYLDGYASLGAGYSYPLGPTRLDLRATMWQMIESANAKRAFVFTAGYGF